MIRLDFLDFETELDYDYIFVSFIDLRYVSDSIILSLKWSTVLIKWNLDFLISVSQVHDGATTNDPILLAVSGLYTTPAYRSSGNHMLIRLVTDNKITSRGFRANYFAVKSHFIMIQHFYLISLIQEFK